MTVQTCLMDEVGEGSERTLRITLRGLDSRLDRSLQQILYESAPEATLDGRPLPVALGKMR